jgi:hypothetical protein
MKQAWKQASKIQIKAAPRRRVGMALGLSLLTLPLPSEAQTPADIAAGTVAGTVLLNRADRMISDRLSQANEIGHGLVDQGTTNLSVLVEALRQGLGSVASEQLREMGNQERGAFQALATMMDQMSALAGQVYDIEEVSNIDISQQLSGVPFVKSAVYISSIHGLSVQAWNSQHSIAITGTGLGPGNADQTVSVDFVIDGKKVEPASVDLSQHDKGLFTFPESLFESAAKRDEITAKKMEITLNVTRHHRFWWDDQSSVKVPIVLTKYPRLAGSVTVDYDIPQFEYVTLVGTKPEELRTRDCGNDQCGGGGAVETRTTVPVSNGDIANPPEGNRRVTNPSMTCGEPQWDPVACDYIYDQDVNVDPTGREIIATWRVTGVWATMKVTYDIEEWQRVEPKPGRQVYPMYYGQVLKFCLPKGVDTAVISGKLKTGRDFQVVTGETNVPGILKTEGRSACANGGFQYAYDVLAPK